MSKYIIDVVLRSKEYVSDYSLKEREVVHGRFPLAIEGEEDDDEGEWWVPPTAVNFVGQSKGHWRQVNVKGERAIWCQAGEEPGWFGTVMGDESPEIIVSIRDILKFPLFVGETGYGRLMPTGKKSYTLSWTVRWRGF